MKCGLYGGAFNPIHRCHLTVADAARKRLGLDRVLFIPTGDPPHKPSTEFLPAVHRLEMVKRAIAPYPHFHVTDIETRRSSKSYSIDTVRELKEQYPPDTEFVFILGLDAFLELPTWKNPEALLATCDFAVVSRPGCSFKALAELPFLVIPDNAAFEQLDGGQTTLGRFQLKTGRTLWAIYIPPCSVSAKDIRQRLRKGADLGNSLPEAVQSYILQIIRKGGGSLL